MFKLRVRFNDLKYVLVVIICLLSIYFLSVELIFQFPLSNWSVLLVRKHFVPEIILTPNILNTIYFLLEYLENTLKFLDHSIFLFPSSLIRIFWIERTILLIITYITILILFFISLFIKSKAKKVILVIIIFYLTFPVVYYIKINYNSFLLWGNLRYKTPFSSSTTWIWSSGEDISPYTSFVYEWNQKNYSSDAHIYISNLGHYRLRVNDKDIYDGPSFAVPPKIYYDDIDLSDFVFKGKNKIEIIANFINTPVHEYAYYESPGLLIGGKIKDGLLSVDLANHRFWKSANLYNYKNGIKISDAGYQEIVDYDFNNYSYSQVRKIENDFIEVIRPIDYLEYKQIDLYKTKMGYYDIGNFSPGYLEFTTDFEKTCSIETRWGVITNLTGEVETYFDQIDQFRIPKGEFVFRQLSRRAGRYIEIKGNDCIGDISVKFYRVGMPLITNNNLILTNEIDKNIYTISLNTLKNNVQDHFEDSVERERAMYIGDAFAMSKCLYVSDENQMLIKEMLRQFAYSQRSDGIIPSMTPSGNEQYIPGYTLQWVVWLDWFVKETGDIAFAKELKDNWKKVLGWAYINQTEEGFLINRNGQREWWNFLDWTYVDEKYPISTGLQLWYLAALESGINLSEMVNEDPSEYRYRFEELKSGLINNAFDEKTDIFVDSFSTLGDKSSSSLLINALAGKLNLFPNQNISSIALDNFHYDLYTDSPYSQTWVIEWMLNNQKYQDALNVIRNYWGDIYKMGLSSLPERYIYGVNNENLGSFSHAWGCGPIWLYEEIFTKS